MGPGQPKRPKQGNQTKEFQLIWFLVYMIYVEWNFERSNLKNKMSKILTLWGPGQPKRGNLNKKNQLIWGRQSPLTWQREINFQMSVKRDLMKSLVKIDARYWRESGKIQLATWGLTIFIVIWSCYKYLFQNCVSNYCSYDNSLLLWTIEPGETWPCVNWLGAPRYASLLFFYIIPEIIKITPQKSFSNTIFNWGD